MKKFENYAHPIDSERTQRAIDAAKRKGPNKSIILVSTVKRCGNYPEARVIQNPSCNCNDMTIILEEPETISCLDIDTEMRVE